MAESKKQAPAVEPAKAEAPPAVERPRLPLWSKLAVGSAVLAIIPAVVLGVWLMNINYETLGETSRAYQFAVNEDAAAAVERSFVEAQNGLDGVAKALGKSSVPENSRVALAETFVSATEAIDHAAIYDAEGELIDVIAEKEASHDMPKRLEVSVREQAEARNFAFGEVRTSKGEVEVLVVVPIIADKVRTGFVASRCSMWRTQERLTYLRDHRFPADLPDPLVVVDQKREILFHPDRERTGTGETLEIPLLTDDPRELFRTKTTPYGEYEGAGGVEMVGSVRPLEHVPWAVVAQVPSDVAYASVLEMRTTVIIAVIIAVLLALIAAFLFARQITAPIKDLVAFTRTLAAREFGGRIEIKTRDELAILGTAMSQASVDLESSESRIREEIAIRTDLGRYLPRDLVDGVVRRDHDMALGGQRREITVLFADVVSFTPLTEKLAPEEVVAILNQLFTILTEIVFRHDGTVDKFVGDCVMAFWGAPRSQEDHAELALTAAEDMMRFLEVGNADWQERYGVNIQLAIGINSGEAVVGNIGSDTRMEYTAIGDVVNIAARLEAIANPQQILITQHTRAAAGDLFDYVPYGERDISGRVGNIELFEVML